MPLNPNQLKSLPCGDHRDGGGLYLIVRTEQNRVWAFRFTAPDGKRASMDFAKLDDLSLTKARDQAREYKLALKKDGIDPRHKKQAETKSSKTFKEYAEEKYPGWCVGMSKEEPRQWRRAIADVPSLHKLRLHEIENTHVIEALKLIWWKKPITADRTRQRIEKLMDAAKVEKHRVGDNPAAWRGNLKLVLPSARKLNKKKGHASVPYAKAPALLHALHYDGAPVARCVETGILTVARSQEIRLMEWTEIDFEKKQWLCPAEKMKIKGGNEPRPHLVPLTDQAIAIIQSMPKVGRYVFPSDHADKHQPFRPNALTNCIKRAGFKATMHGCRTMFRNWGGESREHNFRREVLEHCLSHRIGDESERSYWTGEMVERRIEVLEAWANYVLPPKKTSGEKSPATKQTNLPLIA
ncbi:tyrosine-type recombinase/integrase [Bradyrhizobium erythrophlei]|uniref:Phage integrase family protein n=1 Tax=Bradyrhizobium erythrophlei TaxID=1437360 RepID=A0A1M5MW58_9BRAD|nr:site-specific integrase [Bradyrhizobium erythrophlei]SHG81455.1 Phage integrase family protein [Bradyrhizobium erythrophlei]